MKMNIFNKLLNKNHSVTSLQVSTLQDVPAGKDFELTSGFLIKNISDDDIQLTVIPLDGNEEITTIFYSGWNPELVKKIINVPSGIQIGY